MQASCCRAPMRRSRRRASTRASWARRCWRSLEPTREDVARNVRAARTDAWLVVNDVVAAWATPRAAARAWLRSRARARTCSASAGGRRDARVARGGWGHRARRRGFRLLAGGAVDQGGAARPRALRAPDGAERRAPAFFDEPSVEAVAARVYSKPLTKGEIAAFAIRTAKLAERATRSRASSTSAARASSASRSRGDPPDRDWTATDGARDGGERGRVPGGLIGSAFKARVRGAAHARDPRVSAARAGGRCGDGAVGRQPAARRESVRPGRGDRRGRADQA